MPSRSSPLRPAMLQIFSRADADADGVLRGRELKALAVELRRRFLLPPGQYQKLATHEQLGWQAFKRLFAEARSASPMATLPKPMAALFAAVDKDKSGYVDGPELDVLASLLQWKFWAAGLVNTTDGNADGRLSSEEFERCVREAIGRVHFAEMARKATGVDHIGEPPSEEFKLLLAALQPAAGTNRSRVHVLHY
mmetsp:Transcript_22904/g.53593  ORF Transcript_22904/g.53593 Transcript_22904/m.53593 type:complete len:195 (+) Transcript_22904:107-691(+)